MQKRFIAPGVVLAALLFSPLVCSQTRLADGQAPPPQSPPPTAPGLDGWGRPITAPAKDRKVGPAPPRDISGIWDPPGMSGNQVLGAKAAPDDGKPGHQLPYTPLGLEALKRTKPSNGTRSVLPGENASSSVARLRALQRFQAQRSVGQLMYRLAVIRCRLRAEYLVSAHARWVPNSGNVTRWSRTYLPIFRGCGDGTSPTVA